MLHFDLSTLNNKLSDEPLDEASAVTFLHDFGVDTVTAEMLLFKQLEDNSVFCLEDKLSISSSLSTEIETVPLISTHPVTLIVGSLEPLVILKVTTEPTGTEKFPSIFVSLLISKAVVLLVTILPKIVQIPF